MKRLSSAAAWLCMAGVCMAGVCLFAKDVASSTPYQAGKATFLIEGGVFSEGQSNNIGPAAIQVLQGFWQYGACPLESDPDDYRRCDQLKLGLTMYADRACTAASEVYVPPMEDGGALVEDALRTIQNDAGVHYCGDTTYRPLDDALWNHWAQSFPGGAGAEESAKDRWYDHANMILAIVHDLPQTSESELGLRVTESLRAACALHRGNQADGIPSMPTWVMLARQFQHQAIPFAGLLAAAGGTAKCCRNEIGQSCDPIEQTLDVCAHVESISEGQLRVDMAAGRYTCAAGKEVYATGSMDFANAKDDKGTLPQIRCHLVGETNGDNCDHARREPTDVLGIMACVRQLPRGYSGADAEIRYCPQDSLNCELLTEENGGIEFLDDDKTLFVIVGVDAKGRDRCQAVRATRAELGIFTCMANGEACDVPGQTGRCRPGRLVCKNGREVCEQLYQPMPEICNGLDNDCDGQIDNLSSTSVNLSVSLPAHAKNLACHGRDICVCADGPDEHGGEDLEGYLATWTGGCHCVPTLEDYAVFFEPSSPAQPAACQISDWGRRGRTAGFLIIGVLFLLLCLRLTSRREQGSLL